MAGQEKLQAVINKLKRLKEFTSNEIDKIIEDKAPLFQLAAQDNLEIGQDFEGKNLQYKKTRIGKINSSGAYTDAYAKYKSKRGGKTNVVDLNLTGDYYQSITLEKVEKNSFLFIAKDEKADFLTANYGDHIGVTEPRLQNDLIKNHLEPELNRSIENYLK